MRSAWVGPRITYWRAWVVAGRLDGMTFLRRTPRTITAGDARRRHARRRQERRDDVITGGHVTHRTLLAQLARLYFRG
jgi:hypothetical protein